MSLNRRITYALTICLLLLALPGISHAILQKGQQAPEFKLTGLSGQPVSLASYKGRVLVLDFFATWCGPCKESLPHMIELNRKYAKQAFQIVGMSVDDEGDRQYLKSFVTDKKLTYPVTLANEDLQADYGLRSVPTIFIINKKGIVAEKFMGYSDEVAKKMEALIRKLLAE